MNSLVAEFLKGSKVDSIVKVVLLKNDWIEFHKEIKRQVNNNSKTNYFYLITFTVRECVTTKEEVLQQYIESQFKRRALRIIQADIVKEYTKKGKVHWHVSVISEKRLLKKHFNYYTKKYGFVDISKTKIQTNEESLNYINKENKSTAIMIT